MTERFKRAYDLLIKAYFNDELKAGDCTACAVGNICCSSQWKVLFVTWSKSTQEFNAWRGDTIKNKWGKTRDEIREELEERTMYSIKELAQIEHLFEKSTKYNFHNYALLTPSEILADQFNGLKAVIELMMQFDNIEGVQYVDKLKEKLQHA